MRGGLKRLRDLARLGGVDAPRPLRAAASLIAAIHVPHQLKRPMAVRLTGAGLCTAGLSFIGFGTLGAPTVFGPLTLTANPGDVFLDTVNPPNNTGNEHDPHLPCEDIFVFGNKLATTSGSFTIVGISPTGTGTDVAWTGNWQYDTTAGGVQDIISPGPASSISVTTLIANAKGNGDTPQTNQGFHFKVIVNDNPVKSKTFWVDCSQVTATKTVTTTLTGTNVTKTVTVAGPTTTTTTTTTSTTQTGSAGITATVTTTVAGPGTSVTKTVTHETTVTQPTTKTVTAAAPGSSTSTPSSSTTSTKAGVQGASTSTPATGADLEFGGGIVLLITGATLVAFARRITGHKDD